MLDLVDQLRPRFVLMENVRGLVTAVGPTGSPGEVLRGIQEDLARIGYASRVSTVNAADFGAAQRRVRLFIIATAEFDLPEFPEPTHDKAGRRDRKPWITLGEALSVLPPVDLNDVIVPSGPRAQLLQQLAAGTGLKTGGKVMNNRPGGHWGYRQDSFLANLSLPARTIRAAATPDWIRLPGEPMRRLTRGECAALQGFPTEWAFEGGTTSVFKQIGNAVQVDTAEVMGELLARALVRGPATEPPVTPPWPPELLKRVRYTEAEHRVNGALRVRVRASADTPRM
jgi:DNA (cytosine-5)-methyltransferase 1